MLNQIHQQFITVVKKGRGERLKETPETFTGLFWSGQQAIELGLVEQIYTQDFVARDVVKAQIWSTTPNATTLLRSWQSALVLQLAKAQSRH